MKHLFKYYCGVVFFIMTASDLSAQKDSIWLKCPLDDALVVPPPKNIMRYDEPDLCIVLVSIPDTTVKAVISGRVSNVIKNEDGKWDVVFYHKDYYFWYSGLLHSMVKRGDNVMTGQPLGTIPMGGKLEFLMFNFETPMDPVKYLDCKNVLKIE